MSDDDTSAISSQDLLRLTADVVAAYVSNNEVPAGEIPQLVRTVNDAMGGLSRPAAPAAPERGKPAVPVSKSVQNDYIVCLEDGAKLKMLKRYLRARYDMSPDDYRRRWGLPADYPMVAPAYAERRSQFAKQIGLGKGVRKASKG